jgi:hypothetical protein
MSFVAFAATVGGGSALLGGALIGAGVGGAYSAITGDGDVLNSMLTGGLIGGAGAGALGAMGVGAGGTTAVGAGTGAGATGAATTFAPSSTGLMALPGEAGTAALSSATGAGATSPFVTSSTGLSVLPGEAGTAAVNAGLTSAQKLGYGLAGSSALSLLGNQNRTSAGGGYQEDEYDKRLKGYRISPNYQASRAQQPSPYYRPTYAADGGVMNSYDDEAGMDMANGGIASLGGYSDGGRMLKGPGDGMSDSIPGVIANKQPARLADGEFVVPADVVSHLGNGSTDAGAKRLYSMMDNIRKARTGKKKQAPEINADKYLPMNKKASGGIAGYAGGGIIGYADGGEIASVYEMYLGRTPSAGEIKTWQDTNASYDTISKGIRNSEEGKAYASNPANAEKIVTSLYQDQLGRAPDPEGLKFWSESLAKGTPLSQISQGINQSLEGQNYDTQYITSLYRQNLKRNPEQAGYQYWLSEAQAAGYTPKEIEAILKQAATVEQGARKIEPGTKFTEMELAALESDPFGGRYATKSIYDLLPDAVNVSSIGEQKAQFINPVTQQPYVTNYGQGTWSQAAGQEILNEPQVQAAITVARNNGTLSTAGYNSLINDLNAAKTPEQTRAVLAKPQAQVVVDALYGQQIGEDVNLAAAKTEAAGRQGVLTAQDPGYYQSNPVLSAAYEKAGLTVPFDYNAYKGVDTRTGQANLFTPENFQDKKKDLVKELTTYKPTYPTLGRRTTNLPNSVRDPYSDEGLKFLYGQMMDQYGPPPAGFINPATFQTTPYTYKPPLVDNLTLNTPIPDASKLAKEGVVAAADSGSNGISGGGGERAGGLMAINRKKHKRGK